MLKTYLIYYETLFLFLKIKVTLMVNFFLLIATFVCIPILINVHSYYQDESIKFKYVLIKVRMVE
jgi:hypothetical protein